MNSDYKHIKDYLSGDFSVCQQTCDALDRIKNLGGKDALNCVAETDSTAQEQARELDKRSRGDLPLYGVPVLVKDNINVAGLHTTAGSLALEDNIASSDAPVIANLRKRGAVILGKTNMTEFANYTTQGMPAGYSSRAGQVIHAADPILTPSGSSSGSAVAVAAGIVPIAVGTDTSFSVVGCAQANGISAIKPPAGTLSAEGIIPVARTLDSAGAMAESFSDALLLYSAMRDRPLPYVQPAEPSRIKIAVNTANREMVSEEQKLFLDDALSRMRKAGVQICEIEQTYMPQLKIIMQWEFKPHLEDYLLSSNASRKTLREIVEYYEQNPETMLRYGDTELRKALYETPGGLQGEPYVRAMEERSRAIPRVRGEIMPFDAVIMTGPTNVMHCCGLPSATVRGSEKSLHGVSRCLIMYGADELRLYSASLAVERIITNNVK